MRAGSGLAGLGHDFTNGIASTVASEHGAGRAVYLTFGLDHYPSARKDGGGA